MVEPFSIVTATIGTTLGVLGLCASTLSGLNNRKQSLINFGKCLRVWIATLKRFQSDLTQWDMSWKYETANAYQNTVYQRLWKDSFDDIVARRRDLTEHAAMLDQYVRSFLDIQEGELEEAWRSQPYARRLVGKRLRFAAFSEQTLRDKINLLEEDIRNLQHLCDRRMEDFKGEHPGASISEKAAGRLVALSEFGRNVWALRRKMAAYSGWTLELWPSGWSGSTDLSDWQTFTQIQLWLSFHVRVEEDRGHLQDHRVLLKYALEKHPNPTSWDNLLANRDQDVGNREGNPEVHRQELLARKTESFRDLFARRRFFADPGVYKRWEGDLVDLLLSLANWSALLWDTNWTTNLCSSGIRFVQGDVSGGPSIPSPCLHTLSLAQDHEPVDGQNEWNGPRGAVPAQGHEQRPPRRDMEHPPPEEEQRDGFERCIHGDAKLKLKNLGLVFAEMICATPFRFQRENSSLYERWNDANTWVDISENHILGLVEAKSGSRKVREAVNFCLRSEHGSQGTEGLGTFLHLYGEKVIKP
ncbi:hypothetical protein N0V84_009855 [Fusarium piperis]|uniref:Uncharacterized protein n=1 Tax=Fusarium piperis TaxID=1435070 RepID=A0A9W9BHF5_9HYPO|nr:hypothetical protein N0V84_009855 [Fusarium piperis]